MTVIAWDGKTLAADKQATQCGLGRKVTKIFRLRDGICGLAGNAARCARLLEWLRGERDPAAFPDTCKGEDAPCAIAIIGGSLRFWDGDAAPVMLEGDVFATGSGRDYAIAAMHCGKTAEEAVAIASLYDVDCGMGIDTLTP